MKTILTIIIALIAIGVMADDGEVNTVTHWVNEDSSYTFTYPDDFAYPDDWYCDTFWAEGKPAIQDWYYTGPLYFSNSHIPLYNRDSLSSVALNYEFVGTVKLGNVVFVSDSDGLFDTVFVTDAYFELLNDTTIIIKRESK
jgi:hypothetical protein